MTVKVNLPQRIEQAYVSAAQSRGVSVEAYLTDILVSNAPLSEVSQQPELTEELGIPVLFTGRSLNSDAVSDIIEKVRLERNAQLLGQF